MELNWDGPESYADLAHHVVKHGKQTAPRGQETYEMRNVQIVVNDPVNAIPLGVGRNVVSAIGAAETAQLIAGVSDVAQLDSASNGRFRQYTNDSVLKGAYGPRIHEQMPLVVERLAHDHDTRQAYAVIWRDSDIWDDDLKDVPCTVSIGWMIRDGALDMQTHMRSNDIWYGVPYDFWAFTRLQMTLARVFALDVGTYTHFVNNLHLYERDIAKVGKLHAAKTVDMPPRFGATDDRDPWTRRKERTPEDYVKRYNTVQSHAQDAVLGRYTKALKDGSLWYADVLREHRGNRLLCSGCRYVFSRDQMWGGHTAAYVSRCGPCASAIKRDYTAQRTHDQRLTARLRRFGLTIEDYHRILAAQDGRCLTCERPEIENRNGALDIDHDHATNEFRGLICHNCNASLGLLDDDPVRIERLLRYILGELRNV